jgi:hypothetical protein
LVLSGQPTPALKRHSTEGTVGAAVHGLWEERAGEHAAHEYEILILARPAHPFVAGRPADHEDLPAALIGADEIPALALHTSVFVQLRWARRLFTAGIDGTLNLRRGRNGQARRVPGSGPRACRRDGDARRSSFSRRPSSRGIVKASGGSGFGRAVVAPAVHRYQPTCWRPGVGDTSDEPRQAFYVGAEAAGTAHLYRTYLRAAERLPDRGARIRRVVLDYELKREYQRFPQRRQREQREDDRTARQTLDEVHAWARSHDLPVIEDHVRFPDVRIEYERPDGRRAVEDVEVTTPIIAAPMRRRMPRRRSRQYRAAAMFRVGTRSGGGRPTPDPRIAEEFL